MIALFFDSETTGIKTWQDPDFKPALVQLGCIMQDTESRRVLAELNLIATQTPGSHIPEGASAVHGISDELAATYGIDLRLIDATFARLIKRADLIVAHNIDYDMDIVTDNMPASLGVIKDKAQFCTMKGSLYIVKAPLSEKQKVYFTSKGRLPDYPYKVPNLTETHMHFYGKPFEGAHDAMADIRACRDIFFTLIEEGYYHEVNGQIVVSDTLKAMGQAA